MTNRTIRRRTVLAGLGAAGIWAAGLSPASAQDAGGYPNRLISFVVPFPPGGTLDVAARILARSLERRFGQGVNVENRPGAGGNIGAAHVAQAAPDGYTILMGAVSTHGINASLFADMPFDPVADFAPVTLVSRTPNVLVVRSDSGIGSVAALVAALRASESERIFASGSNGSAGHLAGELFAQELDLPLTHVPYQGSAGALQALLTGEVAFMFDNLASASGHVDDGSLRALAVTTPERSPFLPGVASMREEGFETFDLSTWIGVLAPAGTPPAIVAELNEAIGAALREDDAKAGFAAQRATIAAEGPDAFAALIGAEIARYAGIVKAGGLSLN